MLFFCLQQCHLKPDVGLWFYCSWNKDSHSSRPPLGNSLLTFPVWSTKLIQVLKAHYCNSVLLQMQNALNTIKLQKLPSVHTAQKKKVSPMSISSLCLRHKLAALPPSSLPLRKSSNFYIFNPIKNVKNKKSAQCHAA